MLHEYIQGETCVKCIANDTGITILRMYLYKCYLLIFIYFQTKLFRKYLFRLITSILVDLGVNQLTSISTI